MLQAAQISELQSLVAQATQVLGLEMAAATAMEPRAVVEAVSTPAVRREIRVEQAARATISTRRMDRAVVGVVEEATEPWVA